MKCKTCFLPPNITSSIEPLDQECCSTFKAYFLRWTCRQAMDATTRDHAISLAEFRKKHDTKHTTENIQSSWHERKCVQNGKNFYLTVPITFQDLNCT